MPCERSAPTFWGCWMVVFHASPWILWPLWVAIGFVIIEGIRSWKATDSRVPAPFVKRLTS